MNINQHGKARVLAALYVISKVRSRKQHAPQELPVWADESDEIGSAGSARNNAAFDAECAQEAHSHGKDGVPV